MTLLKMCPLGVYSTSLRKSIIILIFEFGNFNIRLMILTLCYAISLNKTLTSTSEMRLVTAHTILSINKLSNKFKYFTHSLSIKIN